MAKKYGYVCDLCGEEIRVMGDHYIVTSKLALTDTSSLTTRDVCATCWYRIATLLDDIYEDHHTKLDFPKSV